ncbi:MAG: hypothetical protein V4604_09190 [Bacteroidota bacterium]
MNDKLKRDWISILVVPIIILILGWWYTNKSEQRAIERETRQDQVEALSLTLEHVWMNTVYLEEIEHTKENLDYRRSKEHIEAKRVLNESYSTLYVDMLKIQVLFENRLGEELANKLREYIAYGANSEESKIFARTHKGKIDKCFSRIQILILELLKNSTNSKYVKTHW